MRSLNWASGLIPLGRLHMMPLQQHFHSLGLTNWFTPATLLFRTFSPCHPTEAMAGPIVSHIRNPYSAFSGGDHNFNGCLFPGRPHGGFPDFGCLKLLRTQAPNLCVGAQGGKIGPSTLGPILHRHHVMIATDNATVVAYIVKNRVGQIITHSHTLLRLVVDLFLWL